MNTSQNYDKWINGVENIWVPETDIMTLNQDVQAAINILMDLSGNLEGGNLGDLEKALQEYYGAGVIKKIGTSRLANCFAWPKTQLHRVENKIILPNGEVPTGNKSNMGISIVDPIGWASKTPALSGGYGLLGKIPVLRPNHEDFNEKLYNKLMSEKMKFTFKGVAIENSAQEFVYMPTFTIKGGEEIIEKFNEELSDEDIPTAKYFGINS